MGNNYFTVLTTNLLKQSKFAKRYFYVKGAIYRSQFQLLIFIADFPQWSMELIYQNSTQYVHQKGST